MREGGGYKDDVISTDFYKAVLEHGVRTEEEFKIYMKNN